MSRSSRTTLTQFLIDQRRKHPAASGDFNALILDIATACKAIARAVAQGKLEDVRASQQDLQATPAVPTFSAQGEAQRKLDPFSNDCFLRFIEESGTLAGLLSEEVAKPIQIPYGFPRGKYLLAFDPLDGSSNVDINAAVGSIFSVLRAPDPSREVTEEDFLQSGAHQVAAGYALYGPSTMFVLTVGTGVFGFTLDSNLGDFFLTHPNLRIPPETQEFAINASNSRFWETPVKRYVNECVAGTTGPRGKDFTMRWIASRVADAHRTLLRGGIFLYPRDSKVPSSAGSLPLLYQANPLAFLVEQAGGRASTGTEAVLQIQPTQIHQCIGLVFGSRSEVERIERYHTEPHAASSIPPLFGERGLFRE